MDRQALRQELHAKVDRALDRAMEAVAAAPDGQWISASEWVVREAFAELTRDCFQAIIQARVDADPAANAGSFSPGGGGGGGGGGEGEGVGRDRAVQRGAAGRRAERRR
jgi:uncharacterized membrane protein